MSHGPFGLGGGTLAPACSAIVNVAPISVSASASISTRSILVFMFILFALPGLFRHLLFLPGGRRPCVWNCSLFLPRRDIDLRLQLQVARRGSHVNRARACGSFPAAVRRGPVLQTPRLHVEDDVLDRKSTRLNSS